MQYRSLIWLSGFALVFADVALAQDDTKDIVAAAVRQNGFECANPESVKPDPEHSTPEEKAWIIQCGNAAYQVKFMGDRGAKVEPISE
jgi:hypothetical protein